MTFKFVGKLFFMGVALIGVVWAMKNLNQNKIEKAIETVGIAPQITNESNTSPVSQEIEEAAKEMKAEQARTAKVEVPKDRKNGASGFVADANNVEKLNWCDTRVAALNASPGVEVKQEGRKWVAYSPDKKNLNNIEIEKWLGENCTLNISDSRPPGIVPTKNIDLLKVDFVSGESASFALTPEGMLTWGGMHFRSPQLLRAINNLKNLVKKADK